MDRKEAVTILQEKRDLARMLEAAEKSADWVAKDRVDSSSLRASQHGRYADALDMAISALSPPNEPLTMAKLRARIDRDPAAMEKLMRKLNRQKELVLETEDYKRPRAPAPSKLLEPWYRARSFTICHNDKLTDELFSRDIVERLRQDFTFLLPYYDYFVTLEGDPDPRDAAPV